MDELEETDTANLWGTLDLVSDRTFDPRPMLDTQARRLGAMTGGLIQGSVRRSTLPKPALNPPQPSSLRQAQLAASILAGESPPRSPLEQAAAVARELSKSGVATAPIVHYDFELLVPDLDDYRFRLFSVEHDINGLPVVIASETLDRYEVVERAENFPNHLSQFLSSRKVRLILRSLFDQAKKKTPADASLASNDGEE